MGVQEFRRKMQAAGVSEPAIRSFERSYQLLTEKETGLIPEESIEPVTQLPSLADISRTITPEEKLLGETAILKLNGGLGTGMGLECAKALLEVREGLTFLDLIVRQILHLRRSTGRNLRFLLMNSFSTSGDTLDALRHFPELGEPSSHELLQNKVPKVDVATLQPASWPQNPSLEWCPPGHGDLYAVLAAHETIDRLLSNGIKYVFVSNSDNLGATLDLTLLTWFAQSGAPFAMEVTARTPSDRKGGHLAWRNGRLLLRESAQCPQEDMEAFQDISRHRYFNTNNLWLRLDRLREAMRNADGFLPLPLIRNPKSLDPRDKRSPMVYQLETAMGAAIECFADAKAIDVPRSRFAPVKTTSDLLTLRSDAYLIEKDGRVALDPECDGVPPEVRLGPDYKLVDALEAALAVGVPSLRKCRSLRISGPVQFAEGVVFEGDITIENPSAERHEIPAGAYCNEAL